MKAKDKNALRSMDMKKLQVRQEELLSELARIQLDMRMGNVKDTNELGKKKKELAVVKTFMNELRNSEVVQASEKKSSENKN